MQKITLAKKFDYAGEFFKVFYNSNPSSNPFLDYEFAGIGQGELSDSVAFTVGIINKNVDFKYKRFTNIASVTDTFKNVTKTPYDLGKFQKNLGGHRMIYNFGIKLNNESGWKQTGRILFKHKDEPEKTLILNAVPQRYVPKEKPFDRKNLLDAGVVGFIDLISNFAIPRERVFSEEDEYLNRKQFIVEEETSNLMRLSRSDYFYSGFKKPDARLK